jgi:DNA repair exonuclease SbcCD nuclease subunit
VRIVHAADIHLDSPLRGLDRIGTDNAHELRRSTRLALAGLVTLVRESDADLLVIAGDLYDGSWHDFGTGQYFIEQMTILQDEGIPVVIASGNHDAASQITRSLTLPTGVHLLRTDEPESIHFDDLGVVVHGQGYAIRDVQDNLAAAYPPRVHDLVNIGVLHTAATGSPDHSTYAPCSAADLQALQYDYMALGHIHKRQAVLEGQFPAWFSGNLQGRSPRETGPKGALVVDFEPGSPADVTFEPVDVARWEHIEIDTTGMSDTDELGAVARERMRDKVRSAEGRTAILRVSITGTTKLAGDLQDDEWLHADMNAIATQVGAVLEKATARVQAPAPPDPEAKRLREAVAEAAAELATDGSAVKDVLRTLDRSIRDIAAAAEGGSNLNLDDSAVVKDLLDQARDRLDARLAERQG